MLPRLLELVFPARCLGCGIRGIELCSPCREQLPYLSAEVCGRCATWRGRGTCSSCARLSPALSGIRAPFSYDGAARAAVLQLKFRAGRYLVPLMGELLNAELRRRPVRADIVVPVPLAPARMRSRGYNQALLLADQVARELAAPVLAAALARSPRPPQQTLAAAERLVNVAGTVSCSAGAAVAGQRVLLVDDVVTTGATVSACADTLARAGARRITALAFARDL